MVFANILTVALKDPNWTHKCSVRDGYTQNCSWIAVFDSTLCLFGGISDWFGSLLDLKNTAWFHLIFSLPN